MNNLMIKTPGEIKIMAEGGRILARIRDEVADAVRAGVTTGELDWLAERLINKTGGEAAFKRVPGYHHAACINVNDEVVHGLPGKRSLREGDIVGLDIGLFYKGFNTDTSVTVPVGRSSARIQRFLKVGREGLKAAIATAKPGKRVADISEVMEAAIRSAGYSPVKALTGHGVGRELHEEPAIPCFVVGNGNHSVPIVAGMTLAIEIMYNAGESDICYKNSDGWTLVTADGKISGLFEETVAVTKDGPVVLTR